jgi:hypothetical protein
LQAISKGAAMTDSTAQVTGTDVARVRSTGQFAGGPAAVTAFWA